jgi:malate synthase
VQILGPQSPSSDEILTMEALSFVSEMNNIFQPRLEVLLKERSVRRQRVSRLGFQGEDSFNKEIRSSNWHVASHPPELVDRRVEITGPTDPKMAINALNSGAKVWLADLEDANTPHWNNVIGGQVVLKHIANHSLMFTDINGKCYKLKSPSLIAQTLVRPRGLHMLEKNILDRDKPIAAAFFDAGMYLFHNHSKLLAAGKSPYFYLPKLESEFEARLWNDFFVTSQDALGIPRGSIRATVLIETITAAYKMEEILFELREHISGLNAGRWDYLFSIIKTFRDAGPKYILPDRDKITMDAPFMKAYAEALVHTCHKRGAMAIGGMAAFIPNKNDPELNRSALDKVRRDKEREANQGFDGSWVAHPGLVDTCKKVFDSVLQGKQNQIDKQTDLPLNLKTALIDIKTAGNRVTKAGLVKNIDVSIRYLMAWLNGSGAVTINNLMEDAATVEISRSQIWQQMKNFVEFVDTKEICSPKIINDEIDKIASELIRNNFEKSRVKEAVELFREIALTDEFPAFLTTRASQHII